MKVAIYVRVSKEDQTVENQKLRLIDYCSRNNYLYEIFEEVESTRKTRPIKQALLDRLRKREFDAVLVYKLDRWARSTIELILEIEELLNRGVQFISFSENIDFSTAMGKLQFTLLSAFAEFERNLIRERTMEGLARARAQGKKLGRPSKIKEYLATQPQKKPPLHTRGLCVPEKPII